MWYCNRYFSSLTTNGSLKSCIFTVCSRGDHKKRLIKLRISFLVNLTTFFLYSVKWHGDVNNELGRAWKEVAVTYLPQKNVWNHERAVRLASFEADIKTQDFRTGNRTAIHIIKYKAQLLYHVHLSLKPVSIDAIVLCHEKKNSLVLTNV